MNDIEAVKAETLPIPLSRAEICRRSRARKRGEVVEPRQYPTGINNHAWRGGYHSARCDFCGDIFFGPKHELKHRKYCSKSCYWKDKLKPDRRRIRVHDKIAEKALGKILPLQAVVHHVNRNRKDRTHSNLVICQDQAYHLLLHARKRIYDAGGNPNIDKVCAKCGQVKPKKDFHISQRGDGRRCYCKLCQAQYHQERRSHGILNQSSRSAGN